MSTSDTSRRPRRWLWFAAALLLVAVLVAVVVLLRALSDLGDPGGGGLVVENRTDDTIVVFGIDRFDGEEGRLLTLAPGSIITTGLECPPDLIARTTDGVEIARRPGSEGCDLDPWIIEGPIGEG